MPTLYKHCKSLRYSFCLLVICIWSEALVAQTAPQSIYTLETNQSGETKSYIARDNVSLKNGFLYIAEPGKSFSAKIDPTLTCPISYTASNELPNSSRDLKQKPVGSVAGSAGVNSMGQATYSIPIDVPPGTAGMVPHISIEYNSSNSIGTLGKGWNISGLSAITAVGNNYFLDGRNSPAEMSSLNPNYNLELDGNRLIWNSGVYYTQNETFSRITTSGGGYKVETKGGLVMEYGTTTDSRLIVKNESSVSAWYLCKVIDKNGNYLKYNYFNNYATSEMRIESIEYTGNETSSLTPYNKLQFVYTTKPDQNTLYITDSEVSTNVVLHTIRVTSQESLVREYEFKYTNNGGTRLSEIIQKGNDGKTAFNSTIIDWGKLPDSYPMIRTNDIPENSQLCDFNGDGKMELWKDRKIYALSANGNQFEEVADLSTIPDADYNTYLLMDMNSDGIADISYYKDFFPYNEILHTNSDSLSILQNFTTYFGQKNPNGGIPSYSTHATISYYANYGFPRDSYGNIEIPDAYPPANGGWSWDKDNDGYADYYFRTAKMAYGDFDGDGQNDVLLSLLKITGERINRVYTYTNGEYSKKYEFYTSENYAILDMQGIDMNGDGKSELQVDAYVFDGEEYVVNKRKFIVTTSEISGGEFTELLYNETYDNSSAIHDFNGNGELDYAYIVNNQLNILYDYTKGGNVKTINLPALLPDEESLFSINYGDFNGDSKTDILSVTRIIHVNPQTNIWESTLKFTVQYSFGNSFSDPVVVSTLEYLNDDITTAISNIKIGDYNGDGVDDIFFKEENDGNEPVKNYVMFFNNTNLFVTSITNGLNEKTEFTYSTLNNDDVYTKGSGAVFPVVDYQGSDYVVSSLTTDNGIGGKTEVDYKYEGMRIHKQGLGMLGFTKTKQTNTATGISVENSYSYDPVYFNVYLSKIETKAANGTSLSETSYTNTIKEYGSKRIFSYTGGVTSTDKLKNIVATTDGITYDDWGNLLTSSTSINGEGTKSVVNTYVNGGSWCPSKVEYSTVTQTIPGQVAYTRVVRNDYYDSGQLKTVTTDPGKEKSVITTYEYNNPFGNPSKTTTSASGLESRYETYLFDEKGRFITSKTNALNQTVSMTYDDKTGSTLTTTDINGLVTTNTYNPLGMLVQTNQPDGSVVTQSLEWTSSDAPDNALYCLTTTASNSTPSRTYFDVLGRALRQTAVGFDSRLVCADTRYNAKGLVEQKSEPYYSDENANISWEFYSYDYLCRVESVNSYKGLTSIAYDGRTVTTTNKSTTPNQVRTVTTNALGQTATVTDAGGTITYGYYSSGQLRQTEAPGGIITPYTYDEYGRSQTVTDPSKGAISYVYNAYGELESQTYNGNTTTLSYDKLGRLKTTTETEGTTTYTYDTKPNGKGMLAVVSGISGVSEDYTYDNLGRLTAKTQTVDGQNYTESLGYNATTGFLEQLTYPSGFAVKYMYNTNKQLSRVERADDNTMIWQANQMTAMGQMEQFTLGNNMVTTRTFDHEFLTGIQAGSLYKQAYDWDKATGNLNWRKDEKRNLTESFGYDALDRLTDIYQNGVLKASTGYQNNGNIDNNTPAGVFSYNPAKPYMVSGVTNPSGVISNVPQDITYTSFDKVKTIVEGANSLTVTYGVDKERIKQVETGASGALTRLYLHGNYEVEIGTANRKLHYIATGTGVSAIYELNGTTGTMYYVTTDHLGSINLLTRQDGTVAEEMSFDAWGRRRNPNDWTYTGIPATHIVSRGYTGHEHLDKFGIINMNGRVYDAIVGRFLSADQAVNQPGNTQSYNRYSYCLNNPLKYIDPTGWTEGDPNNPGDGGLGQAMSDAIQKLWDSGYNVSHATFENGQVTGVYGYDISAINYYNNDGFAPIVKGYTFTNGEEWDFSMGFAALANLGGNAAFGIRWVGTTTKEGLDVWLFNGFYSKKKNSKGGGTQGQGQVWVEKTLKGVGFLQGAASVATDARMFLEMTYVNELRLDRARSGNFSNPISHKLRSIKNVGKVLNKAGGALLVADIAMSGDIKASHVINGVMLSISGTGVGAFVGGAWFIADYGTMGINYLLGNGAVGLGDMIDNSLGKYGKYKMYDGIY